MCASCTRAEGGGSPACPVDGRFPKDKVTIGNLSEGYQVVGVNTLSTADQSIADQGGSQHFFVIPPNETLQDPRGF